MAVKPSEDKARKAKKATSPAKKERATKSPAEGSVRLASAGQKKTTASKRAGKLAAKPPCRAAKCKRRYRAKGYCAYHYSLWRHNEFGNARFKECGDSSCKKAMAVNRFGYCEDHFQAYYVKGQVAAKPVAAAAPAKEEKKKEAAA